MTFENVQRVLREAGRGEVILCQVLKYINELIKLQFQNENN